MGGKHKQAQLTKKNARPSSSGRSAELLGVSINSFVGFQSVKDTGTVLSGFSRASNLTDEVDINIDANFQLVLKKMNKKDAKTKLKALQEFTELVESSEAEAVRAVLPFWPRLYAVLAVDVEHRVREASHLAHRALVLKVRRNFAPFLKHLAGPWFTSQYDTYAPAASAATQSFQDAFPSGKVQEAIAFCQDDILRYICDNITVQTAQTLSPIGKPMSEEEAEAKYERLLICSLQGYILYLDTLPKERVMEARQLNLAIVSNARFWKLSKSKVPAIRAAFFRCVASVCNRATYLMEGELPRKASAVVFSSLDDADPNVVHSIWQAVLFIISNFPDWCHYINLETVLYPKLGRVLRNAGQGAAAAVFPNLLPLLSHLPSDLSCTNFYDTFFQNMNAGLQKCQVLQSRSEFTVIATTLMECIRYAVMKHGTDTKFIDKIISVHLVTTVQWCLMHEPVPVKPLFQELSMLVHQWERNKDTNPLLLECLWTALDTLMSTILNETEAQHVADRQVELLVYLKRGISQRQRRQATVTFISDERNMATSSSMTAATCSSDTGVKSLNQEPVPRLQQLAYKLAFLYLRAIQEKGSSQLLPPLCLLVQTFDTIDMFRYLSDCDLLLDLHTNVLQKLLTEPSTCSEPVVHLIFTLYKYLNEDDKAVVLDTLSAESNERALCWCVAQALSHPHCNDATIQVWLQTDAVTDLLVETAAAMLTDDIDSERNLLLKQALNQTSDGGLYISEKACARIISLVSTALLHTDDYPTTLDMCASFAAELAATLYTEHTQLTYGDELLIALFSLSCNTRCQADSLSPDTAWEVNTAWQDVLSLLMTEEPSVDLKVLIMEFSSIVLAEIEAAVAVTCYNRNVYTRLAGVVRNLAGLTAHHGRSLTSYMLRIMLAPPDEMVRAYVHLADLCITALLLRGHISWIDDCPVLDDFLTESTEDHFLSYFPHWQRFFVNSLSELVQSETEGISDNLEEFILYARYINSTATVFATHFKTSKFYSSFITMLEETKREYDEKVASTDVARKVPYLPSPVLYVSYAEESTKECNINMYSKLVKKKNVVASITQLTQIFAKHIDFDKVPEVKHNIEVLALTRALIDCDDNHVQIAEALHTIMRIQKNDTPSLLYSQNVSECSWTEIQVPVEVARFLAAVLKTAPNLLLDTHRDFLITSLVSWTSSMDKSKLHFDELPVLHFICAVCELYTAFYDFIILVEKKERHEGVVAVVDVDENTWSKYVKEYRDVFAQNVNMSLQNLWKFVAEHELQNEYVSMVKETVLRTIGGTIMRLEWVGASTLLSETVELCGRLLQSSCTTLQLWAYHALRRLLDELVEADVASPAEGTFMAYELGPALRTMEDVVHAMLMEFRVGEDSCRVQPFTDSYTYTFGYLMAWDVLLLLCQRAPTTLRYHYSEWLRTNNYLSHMLDHVFKIMPAEVLHCAEGRKAAAVTDLFAVSPAFDMSETPTSEYLERVVCWVYGRLISTLPALVRQWWQNTEQKSTQIVEQVTAAYVSPMVCTHELRDVAERERDRGIGSHNMRVKVHASAREVLATYTVDEARMELLLTLPPNYPLGAVQVSCSKQLSNSTLGPNWLMQLTIFLTHQNGRIWEALSLWNNSLDKKFNGVEECYICFSVIHHNTCQLPKLSCHTCKKKFHTTCLYKWFSTSNKSTCPICRNLF